MRIQRLIMFLEAHFGKVELHMPDETDEEHEQGENENEPWLVVRLDEADAQINLLTLVRDSLYSVRVMVMIVELLQSVSSTNEALKKRVEAVLDMAVTTVSSLSESFTSGVPVNDEDVYGKEKELKITKEHDLTDVVGNEKGKEVKTAPAPSGQEESDEDDFRGVLEVHD